MLTTHQEKRASPRVVVQFPIYYFYFPPGASRPITRALNLSARGALIEALDPLKPGTSVAFQMITSEREVLDVRAQVVRLNSHVADKYHVGVRFTHLSDSDQAILDSELQRASA